jgi:alkyl hydroperoxide reductase subunit AhpC
MLEGIVLGKAQIGQKVETDVELVTKSKYAYFVFYPGDFTFVCPTEILELNALSSKLEEEGVEIFAISPDSPYVHKAWLEAPTKNRGLASMVNLPLYTDYGNELFYTFLDRYDSQARSDVLVYIGEGGEEEVVYQRTNPLDVGRNFEDVLRLVQSLNELEGKPNHYCTRELPSQPLPKE